MRLREIGEKINAYLEKFEADPSINRTRDGRALFWRAGAIQNGRYVSVQYISYQGSTHLTRSEAEQYLAFLDQGGIGKHYRAGVRA